MGSLSDKYCIVGLGQTPFMRPSNRTTLSMACEAIRNAIDDAGLRPDEVDGMTSYQGGAGGDSTYAAHIASALGLRLNYATEMLGGGSATEMLVAHAAGLIEGGYCKAVVVFRSMNWRSGRRYGGQAPGGPVPATPAAGEGQFMVVNGWTSPAQLFAMSAMRYLRDFGATTDSLAEIAVAHRYHASLNPKALMRTPITIEDHHRSRWVAKPFRLLDCCLETDVASALIVTSRERAYDLKQPPVFIMGGTARTFSPDPANNYSRPEIHFQGGNYARQRMLGMAGVAHQDIDLISCYDAFTFTTLIQLEAYGFCGRGEGAEFVKGGRLQIDHELPCNTGGGHLSEGYTHGINLVAENVRQLRHRADDACPGWAAGKHTYDRQRGCRQVRNARIAACIGWRTETGGSSLILRSM
jgi:acetyl-CoA acetyltransferase